MSWGQWTSGQAKVHFIHGNQHKQNQIGVQLSFGVLQAVWCGRSAGGVLVSGEGWVGRQGQGRKQAGSIYI